MPISAVVLLIRPMLPDIHLLLERSHDGESTCTASKADQALLPHLSAGYVEASPA
jgi:hypothetical protein